MTKSRFSKPCYRCNRKGHRVKECRIPKRKKEEKQLKSWDEETGWTYFETNGWDAFPETEVSFMPTEKEKPPKVLTPHELEMDTWAKRWEEVHVIHRGWNIEPCKTRQQNPKYYQSFFICGQMGHHSHHFCRYCKSEAGTYWLNSSTKCQCN